MLQIHPTQSHRPLYRELIREVVSSDAGILITTYEHLRRQHADLLDVRCDVIHRI